MELYRVYGYWVELPHVRALTMNLPRTIVELMCKISGLMARNLFCSELGLRSFSCGVKCLIRCISLRGSDDGELFSVLVLYHSCYLNYGVWGNIDGILIIYCGWTAICSLVRWSDLLVKVFI